MKPMTIPGPQQVPGWVIRSNDAIERLYLVVRVSLVWLLFTVIGLIILGLGPASCAAADVFIESRRRSRQRVLAQMWKSFHHEFLRTNLRMVPFLLVQAGAGTMLWIALNGLGPSVTSTVMMGVFAALSGSWASISVSMIAVVPRLRRQNLLMTWRLAILLPGALPVRAIAVLLALLLWSMLCTVLWPLALLAGAGTAIDLTVSVLSSRVAQFLEEVEQRQAEHS